MPRRIGTVVGAALFIGATVLAAAAPVAAHDDSRGERRSSAMGFVAQGHHALDTELDRRRAGAYGPPPAPAFEYVFRGDHKGTFTDLTDPVNIVDVAVTPDGAGWAIGTDGILYRQAPVGRSNRS